MNYAELHCLSNFSFLRGASHPEELVERAHAVGYRALAITDECSVAGAVRAHQKAKALGLALIVGSELRLADGPLLVVLACNRAGYAQLCRLITRGRRNSEKGCYRLCRADLEGALDDCLLLMPVQLDARTDDLSDDAALRLDDDANEQAAGWLAQHFAGRSWLAVELLRDGRDGERLACSVQLAARHALPRLASGDVHMHARGRRALQDVLTAIRLTVPVAKLGHARLSNGERHLRTLDDLAGLYPPALLAETVCVAARCDFSLDELRYQYPDDLTPPGMTPRSWLRQLTEEGVARRWPGGCTSAVRAQIEHELTLIAELNYEPYFLTVWDIVRFARGRGILCQGRGSAANSAVCYCLSITEVDPSRMNLLFERFISRERNEPPDIDVDFEHQRREEVIQYLYERYGRDRAALAATVITYRTRSAVRDVGKALGLGLEQIEALVAAVAAWRRYAEIKPEHLVEAGFDPDNPTLKRLHVLINALRGFPRHLSQHVGGFVIAAGRLDELVPIENASMPDRTVIQWEKDDLESLGLMKVDVLALGMLSAIRRAFDLVNAYEWRSRQRAAHAAALAVADSAAGYRRAVVRQSDSSPGFAAVTGENASDLDGATGSSDASSKIVPETDRVADADVPPPTPLTLSAIPAEDARVYKMIQQADTIGVFQIESRAQMSMLPRLRPVCFYDLVIEVAIVRPGPIQGDMVHPYLRRRQGDEPVDYPSEEVRSVLERTLGVPIFQEQVIKLAMVAAGFTPGEADQLRRSMAAWKKRGGLEPYEQKLMAGMLQRGYRREFAERVYKQILGFGDYGFPESHSASFALLVYVSAWLKCYHPAAFCAALVNSQPMGFYAPAQLVRDAREHGVAVRPVDVNHSDWDCTLEMPAPDDTAATVTAGDDARIERVLDDPSNAGRTTASRAAHSSEPATERRAASARAKTHSSPPDLFAEAPPVEAAAAASNSTSPASAAGVRLRKHSPVQPASDAVLRLGLRLVRGLSQGAAERIGAARRAQPFSDVTDLTRRARLNRADLKALAAADALFGLAGHRHDAAWQVAGIEDLLDLPGLDRFSEPSPQLNKPTAGQAVLADYAQMGLTLREHPLALIRPQLKARRLLSSYEVGERAPGSIVRTAGLVLIRQRPGNGRAIFVTLEDEWGGMNLLIWADLAERQRRVLLGSQLLGVVAEVQRAEGVQHLVCRHLENHNDLLGGLYVESRDFH